MSATMDSLRAELAESATLTSILSDIGDVEDNLTAAADELLRVLAHLQPEHEAVGSVHALAVQLSCARSNLELARRHADWMKDGVTV